MVDDEVLQPTRWHVDGKRYLTTTNSIYFFTLPHGWVRSLEVQGSPFFNAETANRATPRLEHFWRYAEVALRPD